jgi:chemotaxis protein CheD
MSPNLPHRPVAPRAAPLSMPAGAAPSRLNALKSQARKPGEASFFFYDAFFKNEAVKILPGEYFVYHEDILIMTTLGSCIAACLWDREAKVGGMNHFMLPEGDADSGRYGSFAMELLINEMMKQGATRSTMEAKVFGGGQVIEGMNTMNIGERNTAFVTDYLKTERIPIMSKDVLGPHPRKVCFLPASGKAMIKRLAVANPETMAAQDREAVRKAAPASAGGSVDLF